MEDLYFLKWSERFKAYVAKERPDLVSEFTVGANQDENGSMVPYFDPTPEVYIGKENSDALKNIWTEFVKNNPY